jgi:hypothetical protein
MDVSPVAWQEVADIRAEAAKADLVFHAQRTGFLH